MPLHAGRSLATLLVTCGCMQDAPCGHTAWSYATACRALPKAPRLVTCRRMQDAPCANLAWSHATACRTLPRSTLIGHMPLHAGRSMTAPRLVTCKACRMLPGEAGVGAYSATASANSTTLCDAVPSCHYGLHTTATPVRQHMNMYTSVQYARACTSAHGCTFFGETECAPLDARTRT